MRADFLEVPLEELRLQDETYRSSLGRDPSPLEDSVRKVGLLSPLRLEKTSRGLRIVSGFLRAEVAARLGLGAVQAQVLEPGPPFQRLLEASHENLLGRGFTWAERAWVLDRALRRWEISRSHIMDELLPALGLPSTGRALEDHLRVASIPTHLLVALTRNGCSLSNALRLARLEPKDQELFVKLLPKVHLGENLLRECLDLLWEIKMRDGMGLGDILEDPQLVQEMDSSGEDRRQRGEVFRRHLRRVRMPSLSAMESAFLKAKTRLGLPSEVSVLHSPFFEEVGVTVTFRAKSAEQLTEKSRRLWEACCETEAVKALMESTRFLPNSTA
ncbi:MAG: hypothetical protein ACUVS3_04720 [Thermodesulfobacteriota bacterium]